MGYVDFDFKKFEQKHLLDKATLGALATLGDGIIDFAKYCYQLSEDDRILVEERASIIEFDGGLSRNDAERLAIAEMLQRNL